MLTVKILGRYPATSSGDLKRVYILSVPGKVVVIASILKFYFLLVIIYARL